MIEAEWWEYDSVDEMAEAVAGDVGFIIESAIDARGSALIALPGGKTPLPIFERLAEAKLPWKKVTIIPTDDRLVPLDRPAAATSARSPGTFLKAGARVFPIARPTSPTIKAGRQFGRCAAAGSALAARPRLARHGRGRAYRVDLPRPRSARMRSTRPRRGARSA